MKSIIKKLKAIIYIRVSSNEQVKGTSLEDQEEKCLRYCKENGIEVLAIFKEEGESAKTSNRTEFLRALEFCRKNKDQVDVFVVLKLDRFARNAGDHFGVQKILISYGVSLHSVTEPIDNSPAGRLMETILAGTAEFDNAIRSQRSVDGMIRKVRQGICTWKPPLGYISNQSKKHGEKKNEPDKIDPQIFSIIQGALKRFARQDIDQADLLTYLDQEGLSKIRNRKTTKQMVDKILGQYLKFYAGIIVNPWVEGEEIKGLHKPMITEEEMYQIIAIRAGKSIKKSARKTLNPHLPLKKTIKCGECYSNLTGSKSKGNGGYYYYYHCYNKECAMKNKSIKTELVHGEFITLLQSLQPTKQHLALLKETVIDLWQEKKNEYAKDGVGLRSQLSELEAKRKRIFEMREDNSYTTEEFKERKEEVENQIASTQISLNETQIDEFDIEASITYATRFIEHLDRQWVDLKEPVKSRFQNLIFPDGILYFKGQGFQTTYISLILQTKKTHHDDASLLVTPRGIEPLFPG